MVEGRSICTNHQRTYPVYTASMHDMRDSQSANPVDCPDFGLLSCKQHLESGTGQTALIAGEV